MSYQREVTDAENLHPWAYQTIFYNAAGEIERREMLLDDGDRVQVRYDPVNTENFSKVTLYFTPEGQAWRGESNFDNGQRETFLLDRDGTADWTRVDSRYDAEGALLDRSVQFDDGRFVSTAYDPADLFGWVSQRSSYGGADQLYSLETFYADGSREVLQYDSSGSGRDWQSFTRRYDAEGELVSAGIFYDDLTSLDTRYDAGDRAAWSRSTATSNYRDGGITERTVSFDEGGRLALQLDTPNGWYGNAAPWTAIGRVTDGSNKLAYSVQFNDDLTVAERFGAQRWQAETCGCGNVVQRSADLGNGVLLRIDYDKAGREAWLMKVTLADAVTEQAFHVTLFGDDGVVQAGLVPQSDWVI